MAESTATYIKLREEHGGGWGLVVTGDASKGMTVLARRRDGDTKPHVIGKILAKQAPLSTGENRFVCTIATPDQIKALAARPTSSFKKGVHTTRPAIPLPRDWAKGGVPFDGPYVVRSQV
jgi:hypothetical protein